MTETYQYAQNTVFVWLLCPPVFPSPKFPLIPKGLGRNSLYVMQCLVITDY